MTRGGPLTAVIRTFIVHRRITGSDPKQSSDGRYSMTWLGLPSPE